MYRLAKRSSPAPMWSAPPEYDRANWLRQSTPLLVNSLLLTILTQSGVIILELMRPSEPIVSIYAISLQTGSFVVLLATSTNRFYLPQVAILLGEAEYSQIRDAAKARFRLIAPLCGVFLIIILLWGSEILSLFGPEFASGYAALCVVSVGATVSTLFGVSPYYLQFAEHSVAVTLCTLVATGASVAACFPLVEKHGELGAAIAYAVPLAVLYLVLALAARIHQLRRRE